MSRENFNSYIPADKDMPELTLKAVLVGMILAIIMGSANAYLGLYAGMTVSAAIPGAIMALALLKPMKGNIMETVIGMQGAAAGEALAAGVIFTIPALVVIGAWEHIHYLETTVIAMIGGILGVLWMVPLRRPLIVKTDLPFPEGIAVAAVITTAAGGGEGSEGSIWMVVGAVLAAFVKFSQVSLNIFRGSVEKVFAVGKYYVAGRSTEGYFYGGSAASPALLGVGYIVGPRIASYVFAGGILGWVILTPLIIMSTGMPPDAHNAMEGFYTIWGDYVRYIGVGAMVVGGLYTIWKLRNNLLGGIKEAVKGLRSGEAETKKRTDTDLDFRKVFISIGFLIIPTFIGSGDIGLIMARRFALEGADVKAVVEMLPYPGGLQRNVVQCLEDFGIPLLTSHMVTRIVGKKRVERVILAEVDESFRAIKNSEKEIDCDTVALAAGLVPNIGKLREAGIDIDSATKGPVVNEYMETSLPGIFVAGNALAINDYVDYAAEQGEQAAIGAHLFIEGNMPSDWKPIRKGENIRLVFPHHISGGRDVKIYARVKKPVRDAVVEFPEIDKRVRKRAVMPGEMIIVNLKKQETAGIDELTLRCADGN